MFEKFEIYRHRLRASSMAWIVVGLILVVRPGSVIDLLCNVIGALLIAFGVIQVLPSVFARTWAVSAVVVCVLSVAIGIFFITNARMIASILPFLIGLGMFADAIGNLYYAIRMHRYDAYWGHMLIVGLITLGLGFFIMLYAYQATELVLRLIGLALLFNGFSDLWLIGRISKAAGRQKTGSYQGDYIDVEATPVEDEEE